MKTKDYNKFNFTKENREIKKSLVTKLKNSMIENGFISGRPILVTENFTIIDGQNRFQAAKELGIEIHYEFLEGDVIKKMMALNSNQSNWSLWDYVKSYSQQNIDCYRICEKFNEKHQLGFQNALLIVFNSPNSKSIRDGKVLKLNEKREQIADYITSSGNIIPYYKNKYFISAVCQLFNKTTAKQREILRVNLISIPLLGTTTQFLNAFENIINRGKRGKNKIKF